MTPSGKRQFWAVCGILLVGVAGAFTYSYGGWVAVAAWVGVILLWNVLKLALMTPPEHKDSLDP